MQPPRYKVVAFNQKELPADLDVNSPLNADAVVRQLAKDKFDLEGSDFDPSFLCEFGGNDGNGYVLCIQITALAAHRLEIEKHPDIKSIFDPLPPQEFHFGALDPKMF
jgi:hypothetical protein